LKTAYCQDLRSLKIKRTLQSAGRLRPERLAVIAIGD
jgi:hypothetical protein